MYKFYIRMDGDVYGPYSAKKMMELNLLPDIMVTEISIDKWQNAADFDFIKLAREELLERLKLYSTNDIDTKGNDAERKRLELKYRLKNKGNLNPKNSTKQCITRNFPDRIEYKANYNDGLLAIGGKIIITSTKLIFHAHKLNIGDLEDRIYEISQISGYERGFLTFLYISFTNGTRIKLSVWNKSEIIQQLEARRKALLK